MCGIAGILSNAENLARKDMLVRMCDSIFHRGPDAGGYFIEGPVALGHRRLSIIDISTGQQPLTSICGNITIVFNGEIYNFHELREELTAAGYSFGTRSDTEVIVNLYLESGHSCVEKLRGMFAFAIWDKRNNELFIARDRAGIKPLHYYSDGSSFIFGSEMKVLTASDIIEKEIDPQAVDDFFTYGFIRSPGSIYKNVRKLEAGHSLTVKNNPSGGIHIEKTVYWSLPARNPGEFKDYNEAKYALENILLESVQMHLMSEVPLGAFLSGGIDSSTIVWLMSKCSPNKINTFSIGFHEDNFNELAYARLVAEKFGTNHEEEIVTPDAVKILPEIIALHDEPFGDPSSIPTWYVSKIAKKHVTVVLSGDGGDELFAGYSRYLSLIKEYQTFRNFPEISKHITDLLKKRLKIEGRNWNKLSRIFMEPEKHYSLFRSNFNAEMRKKLYSEDFLKQVDFRETSNLFGKIPSGFSENDFLSKIMASDFYEYLPDDVLTKVDRMSMAHSLETRVPFLDHKVIEFCQKLPPEYLLHDGISKRILRDIIKPHLPEEILTHKKHGFSVPLAKWFKNELKSQLANAIESNVYKNSGMFNIDYIRKLHFLNKTGQINLSWQMWQLLIFSKWYEK
ncbi:MAG TPA: asparagine synthase (glutamine-hydrolyzing) [bacterium]|nr:asparagine synthase (glutamine-hydrolyzing) [bacterium]HPS30803.1 asparagine synthase (glutamine-hydrolyzing) [bacterium]